MQIYKALSVMLLYPETDWLEELPLLQSIFAEQAVWQDAMQPLCHYLGATPLIRLQEAYVMTFDRTPSHSLHLFEHIHGESRDRGQAMVDLMEEYKKHGLQMQANDLPDYVPLFLEFLAQLPPADAEAFLKDAIHVLAHIGRKLASNGSPYAGVFAVLEQLCPIPAEVLTEPPVRDMDEALETFGPGADGIEPLLKAMPAAIQTVNFYPHGEMPHAH